MRFLSLLWSWLYLVWLVLYYIAKTAIFILRNGIFLVSLLQFCLHLRELLLFLFPNLIKGGRRKKKKRGHRKKLAQSQGLDGQKWPNDPGEEYYNVAFLEESSSEEDDDYFLEEPRLLDTSFQKYTSANQIYGNHQYNNNNHATTIQYDDLDTRYAGNTGLSQYNSVIDDSRYNTSNYSQAGFHRSNSDYHSTVESIYNDPIGYQNSGLSEHVDFHSARSSTSAESVIERDELNDQVLIPARSNNLSIQSNISPRRVSRTLLEYKNTANYSSSRSFWQDQQTSKKHKSTAEYSQRLLDLMGAENSQYAKAPSYENTPYAKAPSYENSQYAKAPSYEINRTYTDDLQILPALPSEKVELATPYLTNNVNKYSNGSYKATYEEDVIAVDTTISESEDEPWEAESTWYKQFRTFMESEDLLEIIETFEEFKLGVGLKEDEINSFFPTLRSYVLREAPHKYNHTLDMLDEVRRNKVYKDGNIGKGKKVLIIGGGPCGLRAAIEMKLLGAETIVFESRTSINRNNILKLWPFVMEDLKSLGGKKFYPGLGNGSVNHISIKKLQFILLKVCLMLGVEVRPGRIFRNIQERENDWLVFSEEQGNNRLFQEQFDVILGATGRHVVLPGFDRKSLEARMAIAITANFKNFNSPEEKYINEIPGLSQQYDQKFFKSLELEKGIKLENIVYYQGATHYFVMTAKKQSLLERGVIFRDSDDRIELLRPENIDQHQLEKYAREAAEFSTEHFSTKLPNNEFETWKGKNDASIFDFTQLYRSENASRIWRKEDSTLLTGLIGDSLLEPFWPEGTGIGMGFLGVYDTAWMVRRYFNNDDHYELIREREKLYSLVRQTSGKSIKPYHDRWSIDPRTRYTSTTFNFSQTKIAEFAGQHVVTRDATDSGKVKARDRKDSSLRKTRFFGEEEEKTEF